VKHSSHASGEFSDASEEDMLSGGIGFMSDVDGREKRGGNEARSETTITPK
jgi:hypothetical protein